MSNSNTDKPAFTRKYKYREGADLRKPSLKIRTHVIDHSCKKDGRCLKNHFSKTEEGRKRRKNTSDLNKYKSDPFYMVDGIEHEIKEIESMNTHSGVLQESDLHYLENH